MSELRQIEKIAQIKQGRYTSPNELSERPTEHSKVPVWGANGILGYTQNATYEEAQPLVTCRGNGCGLVQWSGGRAHISNNAMAIVLPSQSQQSSKYLYYSLLNTDFTDVTTGSAQPQITMGHLNKKEIFWHSNPEERTAIAHILGTLDGKIELNRKTNETLEAMAKALFKSWFVDFDSVRAKAEGRSTGLPAEISDLFPDSFEDSELGEIPSGWRTGSLDEVALNPRETAKPGEMDSTDRYIGLEHMPRGSICLGESGEAEELESNKNRFREGDILYGKLRPYFKKTGYAQFDGVCSTDIVVTRKKGDSGTGFICCLLASDPFIDFTVAASTGTRMPRTSWGDMCEFPIAIPTPRLLKEFDIQFYSLIERIKMGCEYSVRLSSIRDALLPKLISGEIRIPDAQRMIEEVGV
ncbi:restriction endonuclease subunit S [Synechococcus sp. CBW1108]|uniref:restriction endonuclease subunit S n=1 Tax=Synechococcus sp. CBW1108 TaxID=1353147 RepID=UPI0018CE5139|nr:restriction endonuclease subunit S [Synechococcus sp. CBW1108]QPN69296.1 restriction endonuclease subunit S [Synechococcus sp. CBW1108]